MGEGGAYPLALTCSCARRPLRESALVVPGFWPSRICPAILSGAGVWMRCNEFQHLLAGRRGCQAVFAVVGLVLDRLLARFDHGGVARDRPDDASPKRTLNQRGVDLVWQLAARELGERPGKRGFGRNLRASFPAEDAAQGLVDVEALDQGAGGWNAQDHLGHESSGEGATVLERPARPPGRLGNEGFEADYLEGGDETTQRFGDRIVVLAHPREQKALDVAPASLSSRREGRPSCLQPRLKQIAL